MNAKNNQCSGVQMIYLQVLIQRMVKRPLHSSLDSCCPFFLFYFFYFFLVMKIKKSEKRKKKKKKKKKKEKIKLKFPFNSQGLRHKLHNHGLRFLRCFSGPPSFFFFFLPFFSLSSLQQQQPWNNVDFCCLKDERRALDTAQSSCFTSVRRI